MKTYLKDVYMHVRTIRSVLVMALILFANILSSAKTSPTALADSLYAKGEYAKAAEAYGVVAETAGVSPELFYNMGNAYAHAGDYGHAMLYYSRAYRMNPADKDIKNNLDYFRSKIEDSNRAELRGKKISVAPDAETFFKTVSRVICEDTRQSVWSSTAAVAFILFLIGVAVYLFCSDVRLRKAGFFGGIAAFCISIIFIVFSFMSASYHERHDRAVLMAYKTELMLEPSSDSKAATNLMCQGTVYDIIAQETDVDGNPTWYKVRLNADVEGWLRVEDVEII